MHSRVGTRRTNNNSGLTEESGYVKESTTTQRNSGLHGTTANHGGVEVRIRKARVETCRLPSLLDGVQIAVRSAAENRAGVGRCANDGAGQSCQCRHDEHRLAIAQAVVEAYQVRDDATVAEIAAEFGISRKTAYLYIAAAGGANRQTKDAATDELLGADIPYSIQLTAGVPCRFSVQFEGAVCVIEREPEEAAL